MRKIIALILLIVLSLSSCAQDEASVSSAPSKPIKISAVIINPLVLKGDFFEIEVGIGKIFDYTDATLSINAPNLTIISPDGSTFYEKYEFEYLDFAESDKYLTKDLKPNYFETFRFRYTGEEKKYIGKIGITIRVNQKVEVTEDIISQGLEPCIASTAIYYKVNCLCTRVTQSSIRYYRWGQRM